MSRLVKMMPAYLLMLIVACSGTPLDEEVQSFITEYEQEYQRLFYEVEKAEWASNTHIVEGDTTNAVRTKAANEAWARFVGSTENIEKIHNIFWATKGREVSYYTAS